MRKSLKRFPWVSLVVVVAAAVAMALYYKHYISDEMVYPRVKETNVTIAQSFIANVWLPRTSTLQRPLCTDDSSPACLNVAQVDAASRAYFSLFPVITLQVFNRDGALVFASGGVPTEYEDDWNASLARAQNGKVVNHISEGDYEIDNAIEDLDVYRSFYPIRVGDNVEEILVIDHDISIPMVQISRLQFIGGLVILGVFFILYGTVYFSSRRTSRIIAKQHETNVELAAAKAAAEHENQEKSRFLANVSHELRTPLNSIIGFSEMLKNEVLGPLENEQYKEYIEDIHHSGVHLLSLINDILDFSKAEAGKLEMHMEEVDLMKIISGCQRLIVPKAEEAKVELNFDTSARNTIVISDPKRLKQVILNLLTNAVKFTPEGGSITLTTHKNLMENTVTVEVRDTGIGISEKDISKVMSSFGQVGNVYTRKKEGTGLGLPLTKKLVELMQGKFDIKSAEGEGTSVFITLPSRDLGATLQHDETATQ